MTVQVDIFTLIITLLLFVLAAFLIPMVLELKKAARETEALMSDLRRELVPTLRAVGETVERINRASVKVEEGAGKARDVVETVDEIVDSLRRLNIFLQRDILRFAENAAGLWLGILAASKVLLKGYQGKGD